MLKNLVGAHIDKFKENRKKSKDATASERNQSFTPLNIFLHSSVEIFTAESLLMEGIHTDFRFPSGKMQINAIGKMNQVGYPKDTYWRIYLESDEDEYILFLLENKGKIVDTILLNQVGTIVPTTDSQMKQISSNVGFQELELESGEKYQRVWGDQWTEKLEFADNEFNERFVTPDEVFDYTNNYILYSREIDSGETEWLFVGLEEGEEFGEVAFQVGYNVDLADITIQ